jgi:MFS family permease
MGSNLGSLIQVVGASWLMAEMSPSAEMVALVQSASAMPVVVLSLLGGAIADNYDRRSVMLWSQAGMLAVAAALTALTWVGWTTPWTLLACTLLIGCGAAFVTPAWHASVGAIVPRAEVIGAVTLNTMGFNLARAIGPALGGAVVAAGGATAAFGINAASYLFPILVLLGWKPPGISPALPPERIDQAIAAGARYVAMSPELIAVLLRAVVFGVALSALTSLLPLVARDLIGGGPSLYGFALATFGVGALAGGFAGHRLRRQFPNEIVVRVACVVFAGGVALTAWTGGAAASFAGVFVSGGAFILVLTSLNSTVQLISAPWVLARCLSIYRMALFLGTAVGSWLWGVVAQSHGLRLALGLSAATHLACALLGFIARLVDGEIFDFTPLACWVEPQPLDRLGLGSGPIIVTIEHRVAADSRDAFLDAMAARRRLRMRDGARQWELVRDSDDPELWIERYRIRTWTDYVRHNGRLTRQDAAVIDRVRKLHLGDDDPVEVARPG